MRNALEKYHGSSNRGDYSRFRAAKRRLFAALPGQGYQMVFDATLAAGWTVREAAKFSKLS